MLNYLPISKLVSLCGLFVLGLASFPQEVHAASPNISVRVDVTSGDDFSDRFQRCLTSELRQVAGISLVKKHPNFVLAITSLTFEDSSGQSTGLAILTEARRLREEVPTVLARYYFEDPALDYSSQEHLKEHCQEVVRSFDSEYITPIRTAF